MKYFLAILLLVAVTSATVEEQYLDVENVEEIELEKIRLKNIFKGIGNFFKGTVGKAFKSLKKGVQKGIQWLKDHNLWDPIVSKAKEYGKKLASGLCTKYLKSDVCEPAVDFIADHVLKDKGNN